MGLLLIRNEDVLRVLAGVPRGHKHLRFVLFLRDGTCIVLHEATVAALVRAYVDIVTHPCRRGVELCQVRLGRGLRKEGFAEFQLVESGRCEEEVVDELTRVIFG